MKYILPAFFVLLSAFKLSAENPAGKMKNILRIISVSFVIGICFVTKLNAQNLVLNPSFEITSACPQGISQFNLATNWGQGNTGADSCTTADLYAGCSSQIGGCNSPNGLLGYQASRTGTHHAGIILGEGFLGCTLLGDNYREYIEGTLSSALVAGQKYLVRLYVSLPEGVMGGTNSIGVYFSNSYYSHNACQGQLMPVTPQLNYCGSAIMDTLSWVEIRWIYTATGGETHFTIGNFKNDSNTPVTPLNCASFNPYLYYYIDDVEVSPASLNDCSFSLITRTTNAGCANNDGAATVVADGCTSPFQYTWSNTSHNSTITSVASGNYSVTVTDATSCTATIAAVVGIYTPPSLQISTINSSCTSNTGTAIANVVSGTGPYTYQWNNNATTQVLNNLGAGTYTVTITAAGSCSASASAAITASSGGITLTTSSVPATCGMNNGSATANATGNGGPFTFAWSNSGNTATISNLSAGTYTVTVTPNTTVTNTPFYTEDFTGGGANWSFADGPGTNGAQANQWVINSNTDCTCNSGNYLHITCNSSSFFCFGNAGACTYYAGSPIPNPLFGDPTADKCAISPIISTVGKSNILLKFRYQVGGDAGNDYGVVRLSSNGGATWTDLPTHYNDSISCTQAVVNIPNNYENISNFKFAFRWINNQDGNGNDPGFAIDDIQLVEAPTGTCPSVANVTVSGSNSLALNISSTNANCGQTNGTATVTVNGTGNYIYNWSNGGNSSTISNLSGGNYTVTVNDGNCSATATTAIVATTGLNITLASTNATCGQNNGTVTVTVSGNGNYLYSWSNGGNTSGITNLSPGNYTVTVSENGCSASSTAIVTSSAGLSATFSITQPSCGQANGILNCTYIIGAVQPITTHWLLSGTIISSSTTLSNVGAGTYLFTAQDATGCSLDTTFVLNSIGNNSVTITADQTTICSGDSATICAPAGYTSYLWNTGPGNQCIVAKAAGNYYVTVTDAGNCTATSNRLAISVYPLPPVSISVNGDTLSVYNAVSQQWYLGTALIPGATSNIYIATVAGNYTVMVTDSNGCRATSTKVTVINTGINNLGVDETIKIYPNPLQFGNWNLEVGNDLIGGSVEVFDAEGRLVYKSEIKKLKSEIGFEAASGIYMIHIRSNKVNVSHKLIKL